MDTYNVVVGAVVVHEGSVLLLQRSAREAFLPGRWGIPAGKINYGEDPQNAVLRELREEAGVHGKIAFMSGASWFSSERHDQPVKNMQLNFVVKATDFSVELDGASQAYQWIPWGDIDNAPVEVDDFTRDILSRAAKNDGPPGVAKVDV